MNKVASRWPVSALGSLVSIQSGGTPDRGNPKYWLGGTIPWVTTAEVNYSEIKHTNERITPEGLANSSAKIFPKGTVLMALYGQGKTRGQVGLLGIDAATNQACAAIIPKEKLLVDFLFQFLKGSYSSIRALSNSGGQQNLSSQLLSEIRIVVPPIGEQRKIAAILRTWDEAIDKLDSLSRDLDRLNTALNQKAFEKQFACDKSLAKASRIFEPVSERARPDLPLLAVMQDLGVVRRDELDRRVAMPDGDISNYKVVRPGDFVISLRSFEGGLEYSKVLGLVSPAYTVLRPIREINGDYYRHFFKSRSFIGRLDKLIFGIRDGKQIAFRDFGDMRIPNPSFKVQESDAAALNQAASLLELNQKRKQSLEKQKRGLMQKLLTGEWRVKV